MSLVNENIVKELSVWAQQNEDKYIYPEADKKIVSYYIDRTSEEVYLQEYSIDTLKNLKEALETYSGLPADSPILKQMLFEISRQRRKQPLMQGNKNTEVKSDRSNGDEAVLQDNKKRLPEYRYVF